MFRFDQRVDEKLYESKCKTEMGKNTFINSFLIGSRNLTMNHFKTSIFNNINLIYDKVILLFDKFNISFKNYFIT